MEDRPIRYIIAQHNEDVTWASQLNRMIIRKGIDLPNIGREASSYLFFICKNYFKIDRNTDYVFCQGDPFDHGFQVSKTGRYWGRVHTCGPDGLPQHAGLDLGSFCLKLGLAPYTEYTFRAGAQFKVSGEEILGRSWEWYQNAYKVSLEDPLAPWMFERVWPDIFTSLKYEL